MTESPFDNQELFSAKQCKKFGFIYTDEYVYDPPSLEGKVRKACLRAERKKLYEPKQIWLGHYFSEQIKSKKCTPMQIKWLNSTLGYGAFTPMDLPKGHFVGLYTGAVRLRGWGCLPINGYCFGHPFRGKTLRAVLGLFGRKWTIDAFTYGNETRFINHSDNPNCETTCAYYQGLAYVIVRTLRKIKQGEQLCYDYGDRYWTCREKVNLYSTM